MEQQPRQLGASMDDLLRLIGQLAVENQLLRAEIARLTTPPPVADGRTPREAARA